jgi:hypothetical protein
MAAFLKGKAVFAMQNADAAVLEKEQLRSAKFRVFSTFHGTIGRLSTVGPNLEGLLQGEIPDMLIERGQKRRVRFVRNIGALGEGSVL